MLLGKWASVSLLKPRPNFKWATCHCNFSDTASHAGGVVLFKNGRIATRYAFSRKQFY